MKRRLYFAYFYWPLLTIMTVALLSGLAYSCQSSKPQDARPKDLQPYKHTNYKKI